MIGLPSFSSLKVEWVEKLTLDPFSSKATFRANVTFTPSVERSMK